MVRAAAGLQVLAFSLLALMGCSDRAATSVDGSISDLAPGLDHGSRDQGVVSSDLPPPPDLGSYVYEGRVWLGEAQDPRLNMPGWVEARVGFSTAFYEGTFGPGAWVGECTVAQLLAPPPAITQYFDAGPITVEGGMETLAFAYQPNDYYSGDLKPGAYQLFGAASTLSVKSFGSTTIPSFASALPVPADLVVQAPSFYEMETKVATRVPYAVRWTARSADRVEVRVTCDKQTHTPIAILCRSADDGETVLQPEVLAKIAAACPQGASIEVERIQERIVAAGNARIWLRAKKLLRGGLNWQ